MDTDGPIVTLQAAMSGVGAVVGLSVLVHDGTRRQVLRAPLPCLEDGATLLQLEDAADFWLALLDGNSSDVR